MASVSIFKKILTLLEKGAKTNENNSAMRIVKGDTMLFSYHAPFKQDRMLVITKQIEQERKIGGVGTLHDTMVLW